jgi:hypothetical protein
MVLFSDSIHRRMPRSCSPVKLWLLPLTAGKVTRLNLIDQKNLARKQHQEKQAGDQKHGRGFQ